MAFTGDLEHLPIVDIIQLVHTTRKSGIFIVKGSKGESTIVFRSGYIVGANHINNSVRIGTVLVKTGAITIDDLKQAMGVMKNAGKNRIPLLATLVQTGKLKREDALRGLKKLVELTIVELMSWTKGTFTFDTDPIVVSSEGEQDLEVDAHGELIHGHLEGDLFVEDAIGGVGFGTGDGVVVIEGGGGNDLIRRVGTAVPPDIIDGRKRLMFEYFQ